MFRNRAYLSPSPSSSRLRDGFRLGAVFVTLASLLGAGGGGRLLEGEALKREITDRRIELLGAAILGYYEDVRAWPTKFSDLVTRPAGAAKWGGSYIPIRFSNLEDLRDRTIRDGWGRRMSFLYSGWDGNLFSAGPNGVAEGGAGDDRGLLINADAALWRETKREMRVLNAMMGAWKRDNPTKKLPPAFEGSYNKLRVDGYLPSTTPAWKRDYWRDAWGTKYREQTGGSPKTIIRAYSNGRP